MPKATPGAAQYSLRYEAKVLTDAQGRSEFKPAGLFSPGDPIAPTEQRPVRRFDFVPGSNLNYTPRAYENFSFAHLRSFSNVELVRLAIETRKNQIERLDWRIKPKDGRKRRADADGRIRKVEAFFAKPDGVTRFATWLRILMEDLLTIDAPCIERRRNYGGDLIGLDVIPGDTINLLINNTGRLPMAPAPAYRQIIRGQIWNELTTDDLIYAPRNPRPNHLYGFSPVEQLVVTINIVIQRQIAQLAHFTEGTTPAGFINVPDSWTVDMIKSYAEWFDARMAGNAGEKAKIQFIAASAKYMPTKEAPIKDEFDEWTARMVCFAFDLPVTAFVKQLNRSTGETADTTAKEEGLAPLMMWWKRQADGVIEELGHPDLEWAWSNPTEQDPLKQAEAFDLYRRNGVLSGNTIRDKLGEEPVTGDDMPVIITATGPVSLLPTAPAADDQHDDADPVREDKLAADDDSADD